MIVVSGTPRSGTSMMMQMLEAGGIECVYDPDMGKQNPLNMSFNPNGYFELPRALGGQWTDQDANRLERQSS